MATKPINRFTVQESNNLKVYESYLSQQITCAEDDTAVESLGSSGTAGTSWISDGDGPAKSVTINSYTGDSGSTIHLQLKIDGSYGDTIPLVFEDFPLIINKILIDQVKLNTSDGSGGGSGTDEVFSIISYH